MSTPIPSKGGSMRRVAQRWFAIEPSLDTVKMFVFVQDGTLLLNYELTRRRFYVEPDRDLIQ